MHYWSETEVNALNRQKSIKSIEEARVIYTRKKINKYIIIHH